MKAAVIRKPGPPEEAFSLETVADPRPSTGEVIIRVAACGVCAHDVATRNGTLKAGVSMPLIPGHEVAGEVVATGPGADHLAIGDRVATTQRSHICGQCDYCRTGFEPLCDEAQFMGDAGLNGGYAEYVAVGQDNVAAVPEGVRFEDAAIAACAIGTTFHALTRIGRVQLGETVLVTGATGGLGGHAVQLAQSVGAKVLAQTSSATNAELLESLGADVVIVGDAEHDFSGAIREATAGRGVNVVIDTVGTPLFTATRRSLAKAGRWVLVGQVNGAFVSFNPAQLFLKGIAMLSATSTTREELIHSLDLIERGRVRPMIDTVMPLAQIAQAHRRIEARQSVGRVVIDPGHADNRQTATNTPPVRTAP